MATHGNAWKGFQIVVLGKTSMLSMDIEQGIAEVSPANEVKIDSFENYEDAYDFCQNSQKVGLLIIEDNVDNLPPHDVFKQLATHYEKSGWLCFGILVYNKAPQFVGYRSLQLCPQLLDYRAASDFTDRSKVQNSLSELWHSYISAFEARVVPSPLQDSIIQLTESKFSTAERTFCERILYLVSANLNLSWLEMFALKWAPLMETLKDVNEPFWNTLKELQQICNVASVDPTAQTLGELLKSKASLGVRVRTLIKLIHTAQRKHKLSSFLDESKKLAKPGASALVRHVAKASDKILEIEQEYFSTRKKAS